MRPRESAALFRRRLVIHQIGAGLASAAVLSGLSAPVHGETVRMGVKRVRSMLELRRDDVVLQGFDLSCGAACLATILTYQHGDPVNERTLALDMLDFTDGQEVRRLLGFSLLDLKRCAERRGYRADGYAELALKDLHKLGPCILPVRLLAYDHFVVFRGFRDGRALVADPAFGNRTFSPRRLNDNWPKRVAFVVHAGTVDGDGDGSLGQVADDLAVIPPAALRSFLP